MSDEMVPVLLTPEEVETRLRDLQDERMRVEGPTPDLDPLEVAAYIQDMENETRLLMQIRGLQQNMLLLEGGILSDDAQQGQPLRLELKMSEDGAKPNDVKFARLDEGRSVTLKLGHLEMKLSIGDWCSLIARTDNGKGVPVELALDPKFETDDEAPPPTEGLLNHARTNRLPPHPRIPQHRRHHARQLHYPAPGAPGGRQARR